MKKLEIPIKFSQDDITYTIKQIKTETTCPICDGIGTIDYHDKNMRCPECMGKGRFISNRVTNVVCDEPYRITQIKISIGSNGNIVIKYRGTCGFSPYNRTESNLFATKEEAQQRCDYLNRERIHINVKDIIIKDCFRESTPSIEKIQEKLEFYKINGRFSSEITVDNDNVLQDGYITYLICNMLGIEVIRVVVKE